MFASLAHFSMSHILVVHHFVITKLALAKLISFFFLLGNSCYTFHRTGNSPIMAAGNATDKITLDEKDIPDYVDYDVKGMLETTIVKGKAGQVILYRNDSSAKSS